MITEDYVSFEVAKLLKEKGFDGECFAAYNGNGKLYEFNKEVDDNTPYWSDAPTLQMAMKWLRDVHKIFIEVYADKAYNHTGIVFNPEVWDKNLNSIWRAVCLTTYEEACETAIKYCLENLI